MTPARDNGWWPLAHLLALVGAALLAFWLRFGNFALDSAYLVAVLSGLLFSSIILPATGAFREEFRWATMRRVRRLLAGWAMVVMVLIVLSALIKTTAVYSRIWFGYWTLLGIAGLVGLEGLSHLVQRRSSQRESGRRRLVLVGAGSAIERVEERLVLDDGRDFEVVGRFGASWQGRDVQPVSGLQSFVEEHAVDDVWIAVPLGTTDLLEAALGQLQTSVVDIHVIPDLDQYRLLNQGISEWAGLPFINLSGIPMTGAELGLKRMIDRAGSLGLLVALSPLLLVLALGVKASGPGPVLFRQRRHGFGGEFIEVLKFRSMKLHREAGGQVTQASPGDERVTWIGKWMRRTSLDELPQLVNVLRGEMSLVGPRPHAIEHNEFYMSRIPRYMLRHKVKPGITGWAQVNGFRGITDTEEKMVLRIEHDLWYIQNWSLWLDIRILFRTPFAMVGRNAF